jgi:hypothetical protein
MKILELKRIGVKNLNSQESKLIRACCPRNILVRLAPIVLTT